MEQFLVLGADIEQNRKAPGRVDPGTGRVEGQLPDRNAHPVGAEVTEPEDPLAVGHHDDGHIASRPIGEDLADPAPVFDGHIQPPGAPVDVPEFLAGLADGGGVYHRHHFGDVIDQDPIDWRGGLVMVQRMAG